MERKGLKKESEARLLKYEKYGNKANTDEKLNDSIGSEFLESEEKSVDQKIKEQQNLENKSLYNSLTALDSERVINKNTFNHKDLSLNFKRNKNRQITQISGNTHSSKVSNTTLPHSKLQFSTTITRNDSTEMYTGRNTILSYSSNVNEDGFGISTDSPFTNSYEYKKKVSSLIKIKESEISGMVKRYESLKKQANEKMKELNENKSEYDKLKLINTNMKKMIVGLIKTKEEKN